MGLHALEQICAQLIQAGKPADTPIALVQKGTTKDQKVWCSTLSNIAALIAQRGTCADFNYYWRSGHSS